MPDFAASVAVFVFAATVVLTVWRPRGLNESVPAAAGAVLLLALGLVGGDDLRAIIRNVGGASVTILSTMVMSIVLDSIGFFRWAAYNVVRLARGSGIRLYAATVTLCFLMTMFFNNDGSILITTPIILKMLDILDLKPHQKIPYLVAGAMTATASSAPIGVSNLANLIALKIVGMDLNTYAAWMFVPSMAAIVWMVGLIFLRYRKAIPTRIAVVPLYRASDVLKEAPPEKLRHPLMGTGGDVEPDIDGRLFRICLVSVVLFRVGLFEAERFGVPVEAVAAVGAGWLIAVRQFYTRADALDWVTKTPWHIFVFAFSVHVIVSALAGIGLADGLVRALRPIVARGEWEAIATMGVLLTVMSNLFNNLPAVMLGTVLLTEMAPEPDILRVAYLANILGSDVGALLTPTGTLASMLWMFLLRRHRIPFSWKSYMKISSAVVPSSLMVGLVVLYGWTSWIH